LRRVVHLILNSHANVQAPPFPTFESRSGVALTARGLSAIPRGTGAAQARPGFVDYPRRRSTTKLICPGPSERAAGLGQRGHRNPPAMACLSDASSRGYAFRRWPLHPAKREARSITRHGAFDRWPDPPPENGGPGPSHRRRPPKDLKSNGCNLRVRPERFGSAVSAPRPARELGRRVAPTPPIRSLDPSARPPPARAPAGPVHGHANFPASLKQKAQPPIRADSLQSSAVDALVLSGFARGGVEPFKQSAAAECLEYAALPLS